MTKISSWPKPPIPSILKKPEIPESFTIFGINVTVKDNLPFVSHTSEANIPKFTEKEVEIIEIKSKSKLALKSSLSLFEKTIEKISKNEDATILVSELRDLHVKMNSLFNLKRKEEAEKIIVQNLREKKLEKKKIKEEIEKIIESIGLSLD